MRVNGLGRGVCCFSPGGGQLPACRLTVPCALLHRLPSGLSLLPGEACVPPLGLPPNAVSLFVRGRLDFLPARAHHCGRLAPGWFEITTDRANAPARSTATPQATACLVPDPPHRLHRRTCTGRARVIDPTPSWTQRLLSGSSWIKPCFYEAQSRRLSPGDGFDCMRRPSPSRAARVHRARLISLAVSTGRATGL